MHRFNIFIMALGLALVLGFSAAAVKDVKYVGSDACVQCHEGMHESVVKGYVKSLHHFAMVDAVKAPGSVAAKFAADSPVKREDIKYVTGSSKSYQNYFDKGLKLLPGKWDAAGQKWIKIEPADGADLCIGCHTTNFDPAAKTWAELGVGCESCHGPGSAHMESMNLKDIINPKKLDAKKRDMICGQCHSVGTDPTGKYAFPVTFRPGDELEKHFNLKNPSEGAANAEYNEFISSKHAKHTIECKTCHDPHGNKPAERYQLKKPVNELCLHCHAKDVVDLKTHAPAISADGTCATCHMPQGSHKFGSLKK